MPGLGVEGLKSPVIEDQQLDRGQALEARCEAAVAVGQGQVVEELGGADVEYRAVIAASLVAKGAG